MRSLPKLPVLGWSAYSGGHETTLPGVLNARYRRYTISGRAAISLALNVLGAKPGSKVLVPTYHCMTMIMPLVHADMQPLFYPMTACGAPDLGWLQRADLAGAHTMLSAHYFGLPQPMSSVRAFCDAHGINLIEDCAHAFFGMSDERPVGSWGDVAIASLTKFFPVPEGGLLASATRPLDALYLTPRSLRDELKAAADALEVGAGHGRFPGLNWMFNGVFGLKNWLRHRDGVTHDGVAGAGRESGSAVPEHLLSSRKPASAVRWITNGVHRSRIVALRRRNYLLLAKRLSDCAGARVMRAELSDSAAPYVFPLYVDDPQASYQRLRAAGAPIFRWDEVWPGTPAIENDHGLDWGTHVFQLGCHQDLSPDDIEAIAKTVRDAVRSR